MSEQKANVSVITDFKKSELCQWFLRVTDLWGPRHVCKLIELAATDLGITTDQLEALRVGDEGFNDRVSPKTAEYFHLMFDIARRAKMLDEMLERQS